MVNDKKGIGFAQKGSRWALPKFPPRPYLHPTQNFTLNQIQLWRQFLSYPEFQLNPNYALNVGNVILTYIGDWFEQ